LDSTVLYAMIMPRSRDARTLNHASPTPPAPKTATVGAALDARVFSNRAHPRPFHAAGR